MKFGLLQIEPCLCQTVNCEEHKVVGFSLCSCIILYLLDGNISLTITINNGTGYSTRYFFFALATVILIQVEERRKEALSRTGEEGASPLENSLQDVVSRYSFMDLWPCSSKDMDHLARQEVSSFYKSGWLLHLYVNKNDMNYLHLPVYLF